MIGFCALGFLVFSLKRSRRSFLLLLLLLLNRSLQVMAMLQSHSRQSLNSFNCALGEYRSSDLCCKMCPAGMFVQEPCTIPHTQGQCEMCPPGSFSFSRSANGLNSCIPCSTCTKEQEMVADCSATSDRVCQCQTGHYYYDPKFPEFCCPCTTCPQGIPALQECNPTNDTVCRQSASNSRDRVFLPVSLLLGICLMLVVCCIIRR
ncbi:tumor necrosis factor receptor superfamily member 22-like isoform X2 [Rattus rattus]|uniref:tumor necrosis factor receptor superfamily member 22-like isoform X2 n=1 Tax=Rattus rattus TaxID=10117 RepID=UPI0013F31DCC|nr:tumor necrosis factor receptor superfamily member 22-like isoform X2 [Rattus rattus]